MVKQRHRFNKRRVIWRPHPGPQTEFLSKGEDEVLYGGARGGGKSSAALMGALRYVEYPDYRVIFFRRTFPQIRDLIDKARVLYRQAYPDCRWREALHRFQFQSGAVIIFSHMEREYDADDHKGREYQRICYEELTYFTEYQYQTLRTCARSANPKIKPQIISTTNPGGPGHLWVKNYFIDAAPPNTTVFNEKTGLTRVFVPASVYDNPTLMKADPYYVKRLEMLPEREQRMQLKGDWDVFAGQSFPEWDKAVHVVSHREPQENTMKFISVDWGYSKPFSINWFEMDNYDRFYNYREWYGVKPNEEGGILPNVGVEMDAFLVATGIKQRTHEKIDYVVADPHMWDKEGHGGSIAEDFMKALDWPLLKANNDRISGKNQVHSRLRVRADGRPGLTFSENCVNTIRTLPELPPSKTNPEDLDTKSEDHAYDSVRYAAMSQPTTEIMVEGREGMKTLNAVEPFRFAKNRDIEGNVIEESEYGIAGSY